MYCGNCGAELSSQTNFCPYCGSRLQTATTSISLLNKAASAAKSTNEYSLVLVSTGDLDETTAGDLLEDVFGYTDAESAALVRAAPVVVGESLTAEEAATVAQMYTEYGMRVSITDSQDQYVDLTSKASSSIFDGNGGLLAGAAAIIGALTVANRVSSYRRYKKPSLLQRLFRLDYQPAPPPYRRNFRRPLDPRPAEPRRTIRRPAPERQRQPRREAGRAPQGGGRGPGGPGGSRGGGAPGGGRGPGR